MGLHIVPGMDNYYEPDDDPHEGYTADERVEEIFIAGLQAMREMLARFVEQGGHPEIAGSIRANWNPSWGKDPGRPERIIEEPWDA
jgi:hypothetical protein